MKKILTISCLLLTLLSCKKQLQNNDGEVKAVWSTCTNWAGWQTGKYYFRNNIWGAGNPGAGWQCVWTNSESNWGANAAHQNNTGSVKGYPQMIVGWAQGNGFGLNSNRGNMGLKHQAYNNLKVYWNFTASTNSPTRYLSLIDLYYHWSSNPAGNALPRTNIQIQTQWNDPSGWFDNTAPGTMTYKGQRTIDGIAYNMWYKSPHPDGAAENLVHVRPVYKTTNATHNIKAICAWAVSLGLMSNDEYQTSIQAGWEIIDGNNGVGFETKGYSVTAN
jgi:hypothetical protein